MEIAVKILVLIHLIVGIPEIQSLNVEDPHRDNFAFRSTQDKPRIINGRNVTISNYPYQLSLELFGIHLCGAALIAPRWAITAAHCTDRFIRRLFLSVRANSTYREIGGQVVEIENIIQHSQFNSRSLDYDMALLRLAEPIFLRPIQLPTQYTSLRVGSWATVTGWGALDESGDASANLQKLDVPIMSDAECRRMYTQKLITNRMFCAGYQEGGRDACTGDSGGPLNANGVLIGIVSWGVGCARPGLPGVYTHVINLRNFIKRETGL